jgi:hypothetical protein
LIFLTSNQLESPEWLDHQLLLASDLKSMNPQLAVKLRLMAELGRVVVA